MSIKAVIFDLDGVIVTTDDCHYSAWKKTADEENIYFDRKINERLRGVSRMESLNIILEKATRVYSDEEKLQLATRKNNYYVEFIKKLTPTNILKGVIKNIDELKLNGIKVAIGSSSKNTPIILKQIGLSTYFDAISDGNNITKSKPDPEVFIKAADMLNIPYDECLVVEDADAGITAGRRAGMLTLAVGTSNGGDYFSVDLSQISIYEQIINK